MVTGFEGETLTLGGGDGDVIIRAMEEGDDPDSAPEVRLSEEGLSIKNADKVRFVDPDTGEVYFDLDQEMVHFFFILWQIISPRNSNIFQVRAGRRVRYDRG